MDERRDEATGKRRAWSGRAKNSLARHLAGWVGLVAMVASLWLSQSVETEARVEPYYVVNGGAFGDITPRILFVVDTSGSMSLEANSTNTLCQWSECEDPANAGTDRESRISSARRAINNVSNATRDTAKFALMTFDQVDSETAAAPAMCNDYGVPTRFVFVEEFEYWDGSGNQDIIRHYDTSTSAYYFGALRLCQGGTRRPWPYLRWDELGVSPAVSANNQTGALPASPLISTNEADYRTLASAQRRVQWFPEFMGVRAQLNATTDPGGTILAATAGDYTPAQVWGNDFYYWPYVDGFVGYAQWPSWGAGDYNFEGADNAGVAAGGGTNTAELYAPFYMDLTSSADVTDALLWGPADENEAFDEVDIKTSPMIEGGVDIGGGTPWSDVVGDVPPTDADITYDNSQFSHSSVASYLKFASNVDAPDACAPTAAILLTDGTPSGGQGGEALYQRLSALRTNLNVDTYVVGFFLTGSDQLNDMACAAAGGCIGGGGCTDPCGGSSADNWDTCADPDAWSTGCAYLATSTDELQAALEGIVDGVLDFEVGAGPGSSINEFGVGAAGNLGEGQIVQTRFEAYTEYPGWRGHVVRAYCTDEDGGGTLQPWCTPPAPEFSIEESQPTFGPCPQSRDWDAGECLEQTNWAARRIFSHDTNNAVYRIAEPDGTASATFVSELQALSLIPGVDPQGEADDVAAFILGRDAPGEWKLPGVSDSSPTTVRRVPQLRTTRAPEVAINDPHCAGRLFGDVDAGEIPQTLRDWAEATWDEDNFLSIPADHYEYQEAVMVGDDFGVLHAFQFDSGNELWGLLPRSLLSNAVTLAANGPENMGQPDDVDDHIYGVSSTVNHGWVFDDTVSGSEQWRHLAVLGFGAGGNEYIALDLSHMSPESPLGVVDVLWTTEDTDGSRNADYDDMLGETWARPALAYHVRNDNLRSEPTSFVVFGSGYRDDPATDAAQGRTLVVADALTGDILDRSLLPDLTAPVYEGTFGSLVDPAVGSHCISRYWAEAQETYVADPAGRLFRWDLGRNDGDAPLVFDHIADSSATSTPWGASAEAVATFLACTGAGATCSVAGANPGDPFVFAPAVSSNDRIDDPSLAGNSVTERDRFLVALISGSANDDTLDPTAGSEFHSSIYLLVDDHSTGLAGEGFTIPAGAPKSAGTFGADSAFTTDPNYLRLAVSDIERTRTVTPFPGAPTTSSTASFAAGTRPVRAPRIYVTGVADSSAGPDDIVIIEGVEVYYVTFTVYEPPSGECNPDFFDSTNNEWHFDQGSTYELTFRLTVDDASGFDFATGSANTADFTGGGGGTYERGLVLDSVEQVVPDDCPSGACGSEVGAVATTPCDNNPAPVEVATTSHAVPLASRQLQAFTAVE